MSKRIWFLWLVLLSGCLATVDETELPPEIDETTEALSVQVQAAVEAAFDDAACYCEAYLIKPNDAVNTGEGREPEWVSGVPASACTGDPWLAGYATRKPLATRTNGTCVSSGFPTLMPPTSGYAPARVSEAQNGCIRAVSQDPTAGHPASGFCRADFNYCVAQQLRLKAESLSNPVANREIRNAVLALSRVRFQLSASEATRTLAKVEDDRNPSCPSYFQVVTGRDTATETLTGLQTCETVCDPDMPGHCDTRCTDDVWDECNARVAEIKQDLLDQTPDAFDREVSVTKQHRVSGRSVTCTITSSKPIIGRGACATDVHLREENRVVAGYGRLVSMRIADAIAQATDLSEQEVHGRMAQGDVLNPFTAGYAEAQWGTAGARSDAARVLTGRTDSSADFATHAVADARTMQALSLLERYRVPLPYRVCTSLFLGADDGSWMTLSSAERSDWNTRLWQGLITGVATERGVDEAAATTILGSTYGLRSSDAAQALDLLQDRMRVFAEDVTFVGMIPAPAPAAAPSTGPRPIPSLLTCRYAAVQLQGHALRQRAVPELVSAFADGAPLAQCTLDESKPSGDQLGALGTARATALLMQQVRSLRTRSRLDGWSSNADLQNALALGTQVIGPSFSEWHRCTSGDRLPACSGLGTQGGVWTVRGDELPAGRVLLSSEADYRCRTFGHTRSGGACFAITAPAALTAATRDGLSERYLRVSSADALPASVYVLEESCPSTGACSYRLLDVFRPARAHSVHAAGGSFASLLAKASAKNPDNPVEPWLDSLDYTASFVPPLENITSDNGNQVEDSFVGYLQRATAAAALARDELAEAKEREFSYLKAMRDVDLATESAQATQNEVAELACGASAPQRGCSVQRSAPVTLLALGLVPAAGAEPAVPSPAVGCRNYLQTFRFQVPSDDSSAYVDRELRAVLACSRFVTLSEAGRIRLDGLPLAVRDALPNPAPTFADAAGAVQGEYIQLHKQLTDLRSALREFDTAYAVAYQQIALAVSLADDADRSFWDRLGCVVGHVATVAGAVAVAAAAVAAAIVPGATPLVVAGGIAGGGAVLAATIGAAATMNSCFDDGGEQNRIVIDAYINLLESTLRMSHLADASLGLVPAVLLADNRLTEIERRVRAANVRASIEQRVAQNHVQGLPGWRAMQGALVQRALRDVREAQYAALRARRAIEFRLAIDLRRMVSSRDVHLPAPSTWAADLYAADVATATSQGASTLDAGGALSDYAIDLQNLLTSFTGATHTEMGRGVLSLADVLGIDAVVDPQGILERLSFKCRDVSEPLLAGRRAGDAPDAAPCSAYGGVEHVLVPVTIPSVFHGQYGTVLGQGTVNQRLASVAVNLVGYGLFDCTLSRNPRTCASSSFLGYEIAQAGSFVLGNAQRELCSYELNSVSISGAKALAAEVVLRDPEAQTDSVLHDYRQTGWRGRPLPGDYVLRFVSLPEFRWQHLEDIQIELRFSHWTPNNLRAR